MTAPTMTFRPASKRTAKLRLALNGPSGGGKTYTALSIATVLGKRIAVLDTERGSASLYSDRFEFDVLELAPPFEPRFAVEAIRQAEQAGYDVVIIDSLSHFWEAEGGVLDMVDAAAERARGNSFAGWKEGTPAYRHLIDTILAADLHVICTMRSKTEWILEEGKNGKTVPKRIGMAPVMRAGIEYEFTLVGDLSLEHTIAITKSRCEMVADKVYPKHREADLANSLKTWLESGEPPAGRAEVEVILGALNGIADPDTRKSAKGEFLSRFGNPEFLMASQVEEAFAFCETVATTTEEDPKAPATSESGSEDPTLAELADYDAKLSSIVDEFKRREMSPQHRYLFVAEALARPNLPPEWSSTLSAEDVDKVLDKLNEHD